MMYTETSFLCVCLVHMRMVFTKLSRYRSGLIKFGSNNSIKGNKLALTQIWIEDISRQVTNCYIAYPTNVVSIPKIL